MVRLFKEKPISNYFKIFEDKINSDILSMREEIFMQNDPKFLAENIVKASKLKHFEIDLDNRTSTVTMVDIAAEKFPATYDVDRGKKYPCAKVEYFYKLPKNSELLAFAPTTNDFTNDVHIKVDNNHMIISYQTFYGNKELSTEIIRQVKNWIVEVHSDIENTVAAINSEIDDFNNRIYSFALSKIIERRNKIDRRNDQNNELNNF